MKTLSSTFLVEKIQAHNRLQSEKLINRGIEPQLAVILVGDNEDSLRYISLKDSAAKSMGIIFSLYHIVETPHVSEELKKTLHFLNEDPEIQGIVLQLPLPDSIKDHTDEILTLINPVKDVDGLRGLSEKYYQPITTVDKLLLPRGYIIPPIVESVFSLIDDTGYDWVGKRVVIVGRGKLVGKPLEIYLRKIGINVQSVDEDTEDILTITKEADILITGTGQKNLITHQWVKEGGIVINCSGDVHMDSVSQIAEAASPEKGGIGPLTVQWLLFNTLQAVSNQEVVNE